MKLAFSVAAALAIAAPSIARADIPATPTANCTLGQGTWTLGLGGSFSDCWAGFEVQRYFENAEDVSNLYWFTGWSGETGTTAPDPSGTFLFNNDCGSNGDPALPGAFCSPDMSTIFTWGSSAELVFGLHKVNNGNWWLYSGSDASRNSPASPGGLQNYIWYIDGGEFDGQFLFGWEDLNSGCLSASSSTGDNETNAPGTIDGDNLDELLASCNTVYAQSSIEPSDDDYNDFYLIINPLTDSELGEIAEIAPEPVSMTLLATGLIGLGGASLRSRRKKQ